MRLLRLEDEGELSVLEFSGSYAPPYAILAHAWGSKEEEISFQDVAQGTYKAKSGYRKLMFCGRQAGIDGLHYFWVDTCCMQQSSSFKFSTAARSMTEQFKNAAKCYVFLSDILLSSQDLKTSKFFSQSWNLVQVLTPAIVEFFSFDGQFLGSKSSLKRVVSEATGLPIKALEGHPLSQFSIEERISWAERRKTLREEEAAYSVLGLFGVQMPLLYGEGREKAFARLRECLEKETTPSAQGPRNQLYRPLYGYRLRLFILDPGERGSSITGQLEDFDMNKHPPFNALSYVWGQDPPVHHIQVNNCGVEIRPNLFHALQRLRDPESHICLWVDSLCIDQSNKVERTGQVRNMANIYQTAESVWIWLGEHDSTSNDAMSFIPQIVKSGQHQHQLGHPWWERYGYTSFEKLMGRPWFRRRWVVQEAAFSTHSVLFCGDRNMCLAFFTRAVQRVRKDLENLMSLSHSPEMNARFSNILPNFQDSPATRFLDLLEKVFLRSEDGSILTRTLPLEALVELATFCETTDPRDTIFALLGLANDVSSQQGSDGYMTPDYGHKVSTVFADFILHCCHQSGSLDIICRPWAPVLGNRLDSTLHVEDAFTDSVLPSWIASSDRLPFGNPSKEVTQRLNGKPLVGSYLKQVYNAHGGRKAAVIPIIGKQITPSSAVLNAEGIVLGEVKELSTRMADAIVSKDCLWVLHEMTESDHGTYFPDSVWRILCADRDGKGNPAPSSWASELSYVWNIRRKLQDFTQSTNALDIEELLEHDLRESCKEFLKAVRDVIWNRRTFRATATIPSQDKLIGLAPRNARVNDHICILYGCSVPVVLRNIVVEDARHWVVVGEAYVHGFMDGEEISNMELEVPNNLQGIFAIR